ncbi:class I SAM-dependent methyltransferase [Patescibacteria group bacterium]|nr:class I SAM-dependent methyltransferase [Patescibacteria group bacterium]
MKVLNKNNKIWFSRKDSFSFLERDQDNIVRIKKVLNYLRDYRGKFSKKMKLLDLGCGDGYVGKKILDLGYLLYGLDISKKNVGVCKKIGIDAKQGDVCKKFPFREKSFDVVFAGEIIEHLYEVDFFLSEINRVLKPNGLLILTTPNLAHLPERWALFRGRSPSRVHPTHKYLKLHIRHFTKDTVFEVLKNNAFLPIKFESSLVVFCRDKKNPDYVKMSSRCLANCFPGLGSFIICYAVKKNDI